MKNEIVLTAMDYLQFMVAEYDRLASDGVLINDCVVFRSVVGLWSKPALRTKEAVCASREIQFIPATEEWPVGKAAGYAAGNSIGSPYTQLTIDKMGRKGLQQRLFGDVSSVYHERESTTGCILNTTGDWINMPMGPNTITIDFTMQCGQPLIVVVVGDGFGFYPIQIAGTTEGVHFSTPGGVGYEMSSELQKAIQGTFQEQVFNQKATKLELIPIALVPKSHKSPHPTNQALNIASLMSFELQRLLQNRLMYSTAATNENVYKPIPPLRMIFKDNETIVDKSLD